MLWHPFNKKMKINLHSIRKQSDNCIIEKETHNEFKNSWNFRTYRKAIMAVFIFLALLFLILFMVNVFITNAPPQAEYRPNVTTRMSDFEYSEEEVKEEEPDILRPKNSKCVCTDICKITCKNIGSEEISEINNVIIDCEDIILELINFQFQEGVATVDWLPNLKINIHKLIIKDSNLSAIDEGALSIKPLSELYSLTIVNSKIKNLSKNSFFGIHLQEFEMRNDDNFIEMIIEPNALEFLAGSLRILQFQMCLTSTSLKNLTGNRDVYLSNLVLIDIRFNEIQKLDKDHFDSIGFNLLSLYADNSNIENIDKETFSRFSMLKILTLNNNKLRSLPDGVFNKRNNQLQTIQIYNNPWVCDCSLIWLKEMFDENKDVFVAASDVWCSYPKYAPFDEVSFCDETTYMPTQSSSSTSSSSVSTTTIKPTLSPDVITCTEESYLYDKNFVDNTITIRENYLLQFDEQDQPYYYIKIPNETTKTSIMWISNNGGYINCIKSNSHVFRLNHLKYEESYSVCFLEFHEKIGSVSPTDCIALTVPPAPENRSWLKNKSKTFTISLSIVLFFICIILTALLVFYIIRQHPKLIKGNKRVIMVQNRSVDALIMPKEYERQRYVPPSLVSRTDGYLTPQIYSHLRRSSSCSSFPVISTISEETALNYHGYSYPNDTKKVQHMSDVEDIYEMPPPLPPNHPTKDKQKFIESERC